ncbi:Beta-galactoside alpha-2-6-sialyltransferase 2-like [Homarus americanus]|uniref:beta-galactoside alpha-(2,6)-sialyltransferase n=1 Tax=Homarus americanus TaxID=6706 RepID=A0A8J5MR50_HOMAM|nr:Beta-galactoside alpha-2-6-sialyltransferase 2-like [Homarus americanus]
MPLTCGDLLPGQQRPLLEWPRTASLPVVTYSGTTALCWGPGQPLTCGDSISPGQQLSVGGPRRSFTCRLGPWQQLSVRGLGQPPFTPVVTYSPGHSSSVGGPRQPLYLWQTYSLDNSFSLLGGPRTAPLACGDSLPWTTALVGGALGQLPLPVVTYSLDSSLAGGGLGTAFSLPLSVGGAPDASSLPVVTYSPDNSSVEAQDIPLYLWTASLPVVTYSWTTVKVKVPRTAHLTCDFTPAAFKVGGAQDAPLPVVTYSPDNSFAGGPEDGPFTCGDFTPLDNSFLLGGPRTAPFTCGILLPWTTALLGGGLGQPLYPYYVNLLLFYDTLPDSHDAIVRFNHAPTEGFEQDVGSRTTLRIVNSQVVTKPKFDFWGSPLYSGMALLVWDPCNYTATLNEWYASPDFDFFPVYFRRRLMLPQEDLHLLHPASLWRLWEVLQRHTHTHVLPNPPSSGFLENRENEHVDREDFQFMKFNEAKALISYLADIFEHLSNLHDDLSDIFIDLKQMNFPSWIAQPFLFNWENNDCLAKMESDQIDELMDMQNDDSIVLMLAHCETVDVVEFVPSLRQTNRCHYWDVYDNSMCTFGGWHPLATEKLLAHVLNKATDEETFGKGFIRIPGFRTLSCPSVDPSR